MDVLFKLLFSIIGWVSVICVLLSIKYDLVYKMESEPWRYRAELKGKLAVAYMGMIFIGWLCIYYNTFYGLLWFIPTSWGSVFEGEWTSYRESLSGTIAFLLTAWTFHHIEKSAGTRS